MTDQAALARYKATSEDAKGDAAYYAYVYGDRTQENTAARLASGRDELVFGGSGTENAQTTRKRRGGRTITMKDSGNAWNNAVVLGHESYRDGYAGDGTSQEAETLREAKGHTEMAIRMMQDGRTGENGLILTQNLNDDIINYISGSDAFSRYVADNYDSSADYWKLMDDGRLLYDGSADLFDSNGNLIAEYINENGEHKSKAIQSSLMFFLGISQTEAYDMLINAGLVWDEKNKTWENDDNPTDGSLFIDMNTGVGPENTGITYKDLYTTALIRDTQTDFVGTLSDHNPRNMYDRFVDEWNFNSGIWEYDETVVTESNGEWNGALPIKQLTYEEWNANNFINSPNSISLKLLAPVDGVLSSPFGKRTHPVTGKRSSFHGGTDTAIKIGTPFYAMAGRKV